jgi:hypothetical protein
MTWKIKGGKRLLVNIISQDLTLLTECKHSDPDGLIFVVNNDGTGTYKVAINPIKTLERERNLGNALRCII